ncbi:flavin monoamine oxidase family protein [Dinoroseobacter sp. S76]|uniref:flavin monoamine oxidase family protein n=1 Tax=Dinoroseobacter sp. S76 TaxID=3415124 RepID=UPI003C7C8B77
MTRTPTPLPTNPDVVIIGAGAAGIAAARRLRHKGICAIVLEAASRVGGRAWTQSDSFGAPVDMGCSWLNAANRNWFASFARDRGYTLVNHTRAGMDLFRDGARASVLDFATYGISQTILQMAMNWAGRQGKDVSAASVAPSNLPWSGAIKAWLGPLEYGVEFDQISVLDDWNMADDRPSLMVREGLGNVVAASAEGMPIKLNTQVTHIDWSGQGVRVETSAGTLRAKACILTVSTGVLRAGGIRFTPELPPAKQEALDALPMGLLLKVPMLFDGARLGLGENNWVTSRVPDEIPNTACFFVAWPCGHDYLFGNIGGQLGWELSREAPEVAVAYALDALVAQLGSDVRRHFIKGLRTDWANDPLTLGAYSCLKPGQFGARKVLRKALGDRVFFAGEAVSRDYPALVNGAHDSGRAAANLVAKILAPD